MAHQGSGVAYATRHHVGHGYTRTGLTAGPAVPGGAQTWLAADQLTGLADGQALSSWTDLGPLGLAFTQATGSRQPIYYKTTAGQLQNGLPTVKFASASSQRMDTAGSYTVATPIDVAVVFKANATGINEYITGFNGAAFGIFSSNWNVGGNLTNYGTNVPNTAWHCLYYRLAQGANQSYISIDGTKIVAASNLSNQASITAQVTLGNSYLGTTFYWDGNLAELLVFPGSTKTDAQRQSVEAYLKAKWGTP